MRELASVVVSMRIDIDPPYLMEVTSQSLATAALHMRLPRKPLPPQTTIFRFTVEDAAELMFACFDQVQYPWTIQ